MLAQSARPHPLNISSRVREERDRLPCSMMGVHIPLYLGLDRRCAANVPAKVSLGQTVEFIQSSFATLTPLSGLGWILEIA